MNLLVIFLSILSTINRNMSDTLMCKNIDAKYIKCRSQTFCIIIYSVISLAHYAPDHNLIHC